MLAKSASRQQHGELKAGSISSRSHPCTGLPRTRLLTHGLEQGASLVSERRSLARKQSAAVRAESAREKGKSKKTVASPKAKGGPLGYTPFEYVTFGDNQLTHELSIEVQLALQLIKLILYSPFLE